MNLRASLTLVFLVAMASPIVAANGNIDYTSIPESQARPFQSCARYYHAVCKNWKIGMWLPTLMDGFEPWIKHTATNVPFADGFVYEGRVPHGPSWARMQGAPQDGTPFLYGQAGPPRGSVVYDHTRRLAYYSQGCCSWRTTVLAAHVSPPPVVVIDKSLVSLRTTRGAMLGQSPDRVRALYGNATLQVVPGQHGITMLSYVHMYDKTCGQFQNFGFLRSRLIYIEILGGC